MSDQDRVQASAATDTETCGGNKPSTAGIVLRARSTLKVVPSAAIGVVHRFYDRVQRHPKRAFQMLVIVTVVVAVVTGLLGYQARQYQQTIQARDQALAAAKDSVVQLLSYNYRTIDHQVSDTEGMLTGKFKDDYAALVKNVVAQPAKNQQVAIQTAIVNESVVSSDPDQVVLLMFINQQSQGKDHPNPILTGSRIRLTMSHQADKWLISDLIPV